MYCTVCLRVLQTPFNQVLDQLDSQFQENIDNRKYLRDVYSYVRGKSYNSRSTDLFLEAFSRLYKFKLIVIALRRILMTLVKRTWRKLLGCINQKTTSISKVTVKNISVWNKRK